MTEHNPISEHCRPLALITGASRGIGLAAAEVFAGAGYDLILTCSKSFPDLQRISEDLQEKFSISCSAVQADAGDPQQTDRIFQNLERLDILINNAGISHVGLLHEMTPGEWRRVMSVNLDSCFYTSRCAIPLMLKNHRGHIINISSVWGNVGASMEVAYSASKGGVNAFTRALAKELAPSHIQVNAIACGLMDTSMNTCFTSDDLEALRSEIPADRLGDPREAAKLALQLAQSPEYLTGQIITLDGGWT